MTPQYHTACIDLAFISWIAQILFSKLFWKISSWVYSKKSKYVQRDCKKKKKKKMSSLESSDTTHSAHSKPLNFVQFHLIVLGKLIWRCPSNPHHNSVEESPTHTKTTWVFDWINKVSNLYNWLKTRDDLNDWSQKISDTRKEKSSINESHQWLI